MRYPLTAGEVCNRCSCLANIREISKMYFVELTMVACLKLLLTDKGDTYFYIFLLYELCW